MSGSSAPEGEAAAPAADAAAPEKAARKRAPRKKAPAPAPAEQPLAAAASTPAPAPSGPPTIAETVMSQTADSLVELSRNLGEAMTRANQVFSTALIDQSRQPAPNSPDPFALAPALNSVWASLATQPETMREAHAKLWEKYFEIWARYAHASLTGAPMAGEDSAARDKRFRDPEWRTNPSFALLRETYLATSDFLTGLVSKAEGVSDDDKRKAAFFVKQAVDAASPSNFLMTNPTALRALIETRGESLLKGLNNFADDLKRGHGMLAIKQTDLDAFKVGENIATAPGKVVFRNRVFELIQYDPTTETVREAPLLIFPPWINKFYIMDLQPKNSMIRWLVNQGNTVFVVSWVNPDEKMASATFEDYMREGVYAAVDAVQKATGVEKMNTVGYCIGGTLLAATLAHMAKKGDARIQSATFFASQSDFELAGDLRVFTDDAGLRYLENRIEQHGGILDAQAMADTFNSLRSNDLVWNYVVDNYYLGNNPPPFDLLYWNADQTRMPKTLHMFYLHRFYNENAFAKGELTLLGEHLSLHDVTIPVYLQAAREDHIAPFPSVYRTALLFGGPTRFMMAGSGHIAGVINHPDAKRYQHWTNDKLPPSVEDWRAGAVEHPGSWWPDWNAWLAPISGPQVEARHPGDHELQPLCDAPGEYVKVRSED